MSTTQMFRVYIKATPEKIWEAITSPDWNDRYGYKAKQEFELNSGGAYKSFANDEMRSFGMPDVVVDGEVKESDPPKKLVHTFHAAFNEQTVAEPGVIVSWLIEPDDHDLTRLTIVTEENNSPVTMSYLAGLDATLGAGGGGFPFVLSDLKSLLESGASLQD